MFLVCFGYIWMSYHGGSYNKTRWNKGNHNSFKRAPQRMTNNARQSHILSVEYEIVAIERSLLLSEWIIRSEIEEKKDWNRSMCGFEMQINHDFFYVCDVYTTYKYKRSVQLSRKQTSICFLENDWKKYQQNRDFFWTKKKLLRFVDVAVSKQGDWTMKQNPRINLHGLTRAAKKKKKKREAVE